MKTLLGGLAALAFPLGAGGADAGLSLPTPELTGSTRFQTLGKLPRAFEDRISAVKFSADGREILTVTDSIHRTPWPDGRPQPVWSPHNEETLHRAVFSPDASHFARANNGQLVHVHETATGRVLHTIEGRHAAGTGIAWSPDGKQIATSAGNEVVIHDLGSGAPRQRLAVGVDPVVTLAWSPDARWLAVATENERTREGPVFLIDLRDPAAEPVRLPGDDDVLFLFAPDSSDLKVACEEQNGEWLYRWDLRLGREAARVRSGGCNDLAHSPDGRWLATGGLNALRILDARTLKEIHRRQADHLNSHIHGLAFSPDGSLLATGVENRLVVRDTRTWDEIDPDETLRAPVSALAFSADGRHLVSGGWNGDLVLWDWPRRRPLWKQLSPPGQWPVTALSTDPGSRWIGVVQHPQPPATGSVRLVDFPSGETRLVLNAPELAHARAAPLFTPTGAGALLATRSHDLVEVSCADGGVGRRIPVDFLRQTDAGKFGVIDSLAFTDASCRRVRWTAETFAAGFVDRETGEVLHAFEARFAHGARDPYPPRTHEFIALGGHVWNLPSLRPAGLSHNSDRLPNARHPSGLLHFCARGSAVSVFDLLSQSVIAKHDFGPGEIDALAIAPDGRTLVAGTTGGLHSLSLEGPPLKPGTPHETLWNLMGGEDHWMAYQAAWALAGQPGFIDFLVGRLSPATEPSVDLIVGIRNRLFDSSAEVRLTAAREWLDLGFELDAKAVEALHHGFQPAAWPRSVPPDFPLFPRGGVNPLPAAEWPPLIPLSAHRQAMRAVMILKADASPAARQLLASLAQGRAGAPLTLACRTAAE